LGKATSQDEACGLSNNDSAGNLDYSRFLAVNFRQRFHWGFSEAECNPYNPVGGERFLGSYCLVEKILDDRCLQKYNSAENIEMKGNFSEVAILVLSKLHWGR
jgi:hypothetical protein